MDCLHAVIRGRVQGVGFRDATAREARRLGLRGWVRNRLDGTVEVSAEGPAAALRALESFLRQGPSMANVTGADIFWESPRSTQGAGAADTAIAGRKTAGEEGGAHAHPDRAHAFEIR